MEMNALEPQKVNVSNAQFDSSILEDESSKDYRREETQLSEESFEAMQDWMNEFVNLGRSVSSI